MEKENKEENRADFSKSFEQKTRNFADFFFAACRLLRTIDRSIFLFLFFFIF